MIAAIQAPIILMPQNRQTEKDRLDAVHDYEVNLKAELEIAALHEKIDYLRDQRWAALVAMQQEQYSNLTGTDTVSRLALDDQICVIVSTGQVLTTG